MASITRDADGWQDRVAFMRTAMKFGLEDRVIHSEADMIASYLTKLFGPDSCCRNPPRTCRIRRSALQQRRHEYRIRGGRHAGPSMMPFSAAPGKDGYLWIPDFGVANKITRLDPKTGATKVSRFRTSVPRRSILRSRRPTARCGSPSRAPTSSAWDPQTKTITEDLGRKILGNGLRIGFQAHPALRWGRQRVVLRHSAGKFDPKTKEYYDSPEVKRLRREG